MYHRGSIMKLPFLAIGFICLSNSSFATQYSDCKYVENTMTIYKCDTVKCKKTLCLGKATCSTYSIGSVQVDIACAAENNQCPADINTCLNDQSAAFLQYTEKNTFSPSSDIQPQTIQVE